MSVENYYSSVAENYHRFYDGDLLDPSLPYPANYFRLQLLKESFKNCRKVLDVGCGDGIPLSSLPAPEKWGFDISEKMVDEARRRVPDVFCADITRPETYTHHLPTLFDGIICAGVMPHIENTREALLNIKALLTTHGKVFVEFRNELFHLFAFNRLSEVFVTDRLVEPQYRKSAGMALRSHLNMGVPTPRPYDKMLAKYHNPVEVFELFEELGFQDINILWYHYHPTLPWLPFDRKDAMAMEGKPSWKSMFQCSAFVIEAHNA